LEFVKLENGNEQANEWSRGDYGCEATVSSGYFFLHRLWLNRFMFARKIRVEYGENGQKLPCPIKWLDSFSMRSFTNASVFDDTLPVSDGLVEIGKNVPLDQLKEAMEDWFRRKGYLGKDAGLVVTEM
jgi:hypothetical protein